MDNSKGGALALSTDDAAAAAAAKPFDKITKGGIDAKIATVDYLIRETLTLCVIEMVSGFKFVGTSACVTPANFDKDIGERMAFDRAFAQIWSHEGYLLAERQLAARTPPAATGSEPFTDLGGAVRDLTEDEKAGLASGALVMRDGLPVAATPQNRPEAERLAGAANITGAQEFDPATGALVPKASEQV